MSLNSWHVIHKPSVATMSLSSVLHLATLVCRVTCRLKPASPDSLRFIGRYLSMSIIQPGSTEEPGNWNLVGKQASLQHAMALPSE
ncbi:hypothetical protein BT63DRAFT_263611 [Microthyrium microscopicum]|uniref:Uncharacterized protein n=1 Tax=Microthyrium microscopicum TaxID=703497 RepID=A0A6A6UF68_9PEZI|nr:hypothetical protein BT63DRAFT_263611 [Microthyrium microscopicum]